VAELVSIGTLPESHCFMHKAM